jgi:hypothetical protein
LVTFFGIGVGVAAGVALAGGFGGNVGWCPLGWQEPYHPWYRSSPNYLRNVNVTSVRDVNRITTVNNVTINNFANRGAATMVPARAMALSQPIGREARPLPAAQFADARPLLGRDPIAPTTATVGVDRRVAQDLRLGPPPPGAGPAMRPAAPGPAIRGYANAPNVRPGLEPNGRPPMTTERAPGPPIEPRGALLTPNGAPLLRPPGTPMEVRPGTMPQNEVRQAPRVLTPGVPPRPEFAAPLARPPIHEPVPPPRIVEQTRPVELPRVVQPRPYEAPHVVQQVRPFEPPHPVQLARPGPPPQQHFVQQSRPAPPPPPQIHNAEQGPHPAPPPPGQGKERRQPS